MQRSTSEPAPGFTPLPPVAVGGKEIPGAFPDGMPGIQGPSPNAGKDVAGIELVGSPVNQFGVQQTGALHLNEVITYKDGSVDVIGYFPPPSSSNVLSESQPLYADRASARSFSELPANVQHDVQEGREHYRIDVPPTAGRSLTQIAHAQDRQWQSYNQNPLPYDGIGERYHNSNGAMNASFAAVGRSDISRQLERDLSDLPEHALQKGAGDWADRAEVQELKRSVARAPIAPGVDNPPTVAEINGTAERNVGHRLSIQAQGVQNSQATLEALRGAAASAVRKVEETPGDMERNFKKGLDDFLDDRMRQGLRANGVSAIAPWNGNAREGRIVHADDQFVIQSTGRGTGVAYGVAEHLNGSAPSVGEYVSISKSGIAMERSPTQTNELGRA